PIGPERIGHRRRPGNEWTVRPPCPASPPASGPPAGGPSPARRLPIPATREHGPLPPRGGHAPVIGPDHLHRCDSSQLLGRRVEQPQLGLSLPSRGGLPVVTLHRHQL